MSKAILMHLLLLCPLATALTQESIPPNSEPAASNAADPYAAGFAELEKQRIERFRRNQEAAQRLIQIPVQQTEQQIMIGGLGEEPQAKATDAKLTLHVTDAVTGKAIDSFWVELSSESTRWIMGGPGGPKYLHHLHEYYYYDPLNSDPWFGKQHKGLDQPLTIERMSREMWRVTIRSQGYVRSSQAINIKDAQAELKFQLTPATSSFRGRLINAATSLPIEGAEISVRYEVENNFSIKDWDNDIEQVTGEDGRFQLQQLPSADFTTVVSIKGKEYFGIEKAFKAGEARQEDLGDIKLTPYAWITGKVVDAAGRPVVGQLVYVIPDSIDHTDQVAVVSHLHGRRKSTGNPGKVWQVTTNELGQFSTYNTEAPWSPATPPMRTGTFRVVAGHADSEQVTVKVSPGEKKIVELRKKLR